MRPGIAGRVEAASKMAVPAPKGKGIAMMLIGVAVLGGLIYDFVGGSGASKKVRSISERQGKAVTAESAPGEALELVIEDEGQTLTMSSSAAIAYYTSAPAAKQAEIRPRLLAILAATEGLAGARGQEAFELASRLLEGADARARDSIADLALKGIALLKDDTAAPAVAFFLGAMPEGIDRTTARALDNVIIDKARPIHVRVAAAQARPAEGRSEAVQALMRDGKTHPQLRAALKK
ncbi:MAG: hypothetical protein P1V36_05170 [Planctomycetota bacterium]|nr:hypothetical protein [Planctomycetota bacterium]